MTITYLREVFGWSSLWLFVVCDAVAIWQLACWLAG